MFYLSITVFFEYHGGINFKSTVTVGLKRRLLASRAERDDTAQE